MKVDNYLEINKKSWNNRLASHLESDFYNMEGFMNGQSSLKSIELGLLGDVKGKSILHLQCHFGQDSISLSQLGANVVGVDLSNKAIDNAKKIASELNVDTEFICCDIYELPKYLDKKFDIVFTSYGTITWLPDLDKWANIISSFLKPNGRFVFAEFHPVVWMFDDDFTKVDYHYLNIEPIIETESGTYADKEAKISQEYVCWNHGISEVVNSLIKHDLNLLSLDEFDYSPYNCLSNMIEFESGRFRIKTLGKKIPLVYAINAIKNG